MKKLYRLIPALRFFSKSDKDYFILILFIVVVVAIIYAVGAVLVSFIPKQNKPNKEDFYIRKHRMDKNERKVYESSQRDNQKYFFRGILIFFICLVLVSLFF